MKYIRWIIALSAIAFTGAAHAQTMSLSADDAVAIALRENPIMQAQRLNKQAQLAGISEEEARFGRTLSLQMSHADSREPSISSLEGVPTSHTNAQRASFALSQNLTTGGRLDIALSQNRTSNDAGFRTIDPVYDSDISFRFTQPLLRGRGDAAPARALGFAHSAVRVVEHRGGRLDLDGQLLLFRPEGEDRHEGHASLDLPDAVAEERPPRDRLGRFRELRRDRGQVHEQTARQQMPGQASIHVVSSLRAASSRDHVYPWDPCVGLGACAW